MEMDKVLALEVTKESTDLKSINSINTQYILNDTVEGFSAEDEAEIVKEFKSSKESFLKDGEMHMASNLLTVENNVKQSPLPSHDHLTSYKSINKCFVKMMKTIDNLDEATVYKPANTVENRVNGRNDVTKNICNTREGYNGKKRCKKSTKKHSGRKGKNPLMHDMMDDLSLVLDVKLRVAEKNKCINYTY